MTIEISEVETLVRASLVAVAEHDPVPPRPALPLAATDRQPRLHGRRRRHVNVTLAAAGTMLAVGSAAAAAGLVPAAITRAFGTNMYGTSMHDAQMVAQVVTPNGSRIQEWTGHNTAGGTCQLSIALSRTGKILDKGTNCTDSAGFKTIKYKFTADWGVLSQGGRGRPGLIYVEARTSMHSITAIDLAVAGISIPLNFDPSTGWGLAYVPTTQVRSGGYVTAYDREHHVIARARLGEAPPI